ncbi:MAG TPA: PIN domain-containing protein [Bryobacteraceae bacterium]|nr:PIN domain-containing protein [Bryobacteraceae bacterium]
MILVDTSVWITLIKGARHQGLSPDEVLRFVTCAPILQELFQGMREDSRTNTLRENFLAMPCLSAPTPLGAFLEAAEIYRFGRRKGYTIRSSTDCLIAAIAIEHDVAVWHHNRDFTTIAKFTKLRAFHAAASYRIH